METNKERRKWITSLEMKFGTKLKASMQDFSWQQKTDFLEALIEYVQILIEGKQGTENFLTEKILKPFKTSLQTAMREKLFSCFDREFAFAELGIISSETFNSLDSEEQGMTLEEYSMFLGNMLRYLQTVHQHHLVFESDDTKENNSESTLGNGNDKGRIKRESGDGITKLNQEQTALLIEYLQHGRIILKGEYLNAKQAGIAFHTLTGYSSENLRIKLGEKEISKLRTKENLTELHNVLTQLTILINKDIGNLKKN